jgi:hypothetical protein
MTWERKILLGDLGRVCGSRDPHILMDWLQERGLVSDEAVKLDDVPTGDLLRAKNRMEQKGLK